ncbi:MAG: Gfo/Idh/MocA family oxidoreductase [Acidobacteria bacterium]|nr:Gfo/Idh/MocA family oxidoreductase [Acidobacteriota bacterium]
MMNNISEQPVGIGIIGCGYWGINYVRVLQEIPEAKLIAVCDQRLDRLNEIGRRLPDLKLTTNVTDVLSDDRVNAVIVCTEATSHFKVANQCLQAKKHILIEKPVSTLVSEALELARVAKEVSCTLMVGHTFVYNGGITAIKSYLADHSDTIYYLHASRTNLGPIRRDVNAIWDLGTHDIAIFNYLLNASPCWVSAVGGRVLGNCRVDVGFICLGYENGVIGHVHVSWADPNKCREIVVVCSGMRLVFNDLNAAEPVRIYEKGVSAVDAEPQSFGEYQLKIREGSIISPSIEPSEPLKNECRHFIECIRSGIKPRSSIEDGINVLRTLEAIDRSVRLQGTTVKVE